MKKTSRREMAVLIANTTCTPYTALRRDPSAGLMTRLAANVADTCPKAALRSSSVVTSETYANTMEKVTEHTPERATTSTCHHKLETRRNGSGRHVAPTARRRNCLRPCESDTAPITGALRNDRNPLSPCVRPSTSHLLSGPKKSANA